MSFYEEMASLATELIDEFGAGSTLIRESSAGYSPAAGSVTSPSTATFQVKAAVFDMPQHLINGTTILQGDKQAFLSVKDGFTPKVGDKLQWGGEKLRVITFKPLAPALLAVLWELQLRN